MRDDLTTGERTKRAIGAERPVMNLYRIGLYLAFAGMILGAAMTEGGAAPAGNRGLGERLNAVRADIKADADETKRAEDSIALFAVAMDLYDSGDVGATTALLIATNEYARVMQDAAQPVSPGSPPIYSVGDCVYFLSCYGKRVMGDTEDCVVCCVDSCMSVPDPSDRADCIRDCVIRCTQPLTLPPLARDYCDGID